MDVIGNNIANVNTTGFKSSRVTFADQLSQTLSGASKPADNGSIGGTNPKQVGLGVGVASTDLLFTDASAQQTGKNTDLALSGNGLFVVKTNSGQFYTRDGNFVFDAKGNYVMHGNGAFVQGWKADGEGHVNTASSLGNIQIVANATMPATASKEVVYSGNLNSATPTITGIKDQNGAAVSSPASISGTTTSLTLTLSDGTQTTVTEPGTIYTTGHSIPMTTIAEVYDSLGHSHEVLLAFEKIPGTTASPQSKWEVKLAQTTIKESDGSTTTVAMSPQTIVFDHNGKFASGGSNATLTLTNGAGSSPATPPPVNNMKVEVNYSGLTQYSGGNTQKADSDGHASGTLKEVSVDASGKITGTYTNGLRRVEAQVAVAQFNNASGLTKMGGNLYAESNNSGRVKNGAVIKTASDFGCSITPSALEMSNVDIANEFSDMIITQRGFQSNSKIITVDDEMLETVIGMKR